MNFVALDVETANPNLSSICQIGIVKFDNGDISEKWGSLVNPQDYFHPMNISVHGIDSHHVKNAPTFPDIANEIDKRINGEVVVIHTGFDKSAISQAFGKFRMQPPKCSWLDSSSVARRAWDDVSQRGYGLKPLAERFGIEFSHHDALEDARAAGLILLRAMIETGIGIEEWLRRVSLPISTYHHNSNHTPSHRSSMFPHLQVAQHGNTEGALFGETIVFTGSLSVTRQEAAELAAHAGCEVANNVTKHTTLLVVGDQDTKLLAGHDKSIKHRKAEELSAKGIRIRILGESDFKALIGK